MVLVGSCGRGRDLPNERVPVMATVTLGIVPMDDVGPVYRVSDDWDYSPPYSNASDVCDRQGPCPGPTDIMDPCTGICGPPNANTKLLEQLNRLGYQPYTSTPGDGNVSVIGSGGVTGGSSTGILSGVPNLLLLAGGLLVLLMAAKR